MIWVDERVMLTRHARNWVSPKTQASCLVTAGQDVQHVLIGPYRFAGNDWRMMWRPTTAAYAPWVEADTQAMAADLALAKIVILPELHHLASWEYPARVNARLLAFLQLNS